MTIQAKFPLNSTYLIMGASLFSFFTDILHEDKVIEYIMHYDVLIGLHVHHYFFTNQCLQKHSNNYLVLICSPK